MFSRMNALWLRIPWVLSVPAVVVSGAVAIAATGYFTGPLFHETCHNERNLLTGEFDPSNCGEGAKVAARPPATAQPGAPTVAAETGTPPPDATAPAGTAVPAQAGGILAMGEFQDGEPGHHGAGTAQLQRLADGRLNLFLSNFSVTNGPDLVVVLSTDTEGSKSSVSSGLTLESLKANNGNQNYGIPAGTDLTRFKSVIVFCKSFPTVFAFATLEVSS